MYLPHHTVCTSICRRFSVIRRPMNTTPRPFLCPSSRRGVCLVLRICPVKRAILATSLQPLPFVGPPPRRPFVCARSLPKARLHPRTPPAADSTFRIPCSPQAILSAASRPIGLDGSGRTADHTPLALIGQVRLTPPTGVQSASGTTRGQRINPACGGILCRRDSPHLCGFCPSHSNYLASH